MSMDVLGTRSALRLTGVLHTNPVLKGRVQMQRGRMVNVEWDLPRDRVDILHAR
jgi:hypothetical protein